MRRLALIVEGYGDVDAMPSLVAKVGRAFGNDVCSLDPPIRAGEARKFKREGELERFLEMAASRDGADGILVVVDMDDDCAAEFHEEFVERGKKISSRTQQDIYYVFCVREFEGWFLANIGDLRASLPEYGIVPDVEFQSSSSVRAAKEKLSEICRVKRYKQSRDQLLFTKKINVYRLALKDRSFRKFVKSVTGRDYPDIERTAMAALGMDLTDLGAV